MLSNIPNVFVYSMMQMAFHSAQRGPETSTEHGRSQVIHHLIANCVDDNSNLGLLFGGLYTLALTLFNELPDTGKMIGSF